MRCIAKLSVASAFASLGCGLLTPYPGGGDPAQLLDRVTNEDGASPIEGGKPQDPLIDPAIDQSVSVVSLEDVIVAIPGESFLVTLDFVAPNENVVGGGIQFPSSDRVQWTLIDGLLGNRSGRLQFAYAVPTDLCDDVPSQCHTVDTKQFAVARNTASGKDVDGDGEPDGDFVVSRPDEVAIVLKCASCESNSCVEALPGGTCSSCTQPAECREAYDLCFAPGRPKEGTTEAEQFELFFGANGFAWKSEASCAQAEGFCEAALESARDECPLEGEDEGEGESR